MATSGKLQLILNDSELKSISDKIISKLEIYLSTQCGSIEELQSENTKIRSLSERHEFLLEKEALESQSKLKESLESCEKLRAKVSELEQKLSSSQQQCRDLQKTHNSTVLEVQTLKKNNQHLTQETQEFVNQLGKRRKEIEELTEQVRELTKKLNVENESKFEMKMKVEEVEIRESTYQHQIKRLEEEKNIIKQQLEALTDEVSLKSREILTLKKEKSSSVLDLQTELDERLEEVHSLQTQVNKLKEKVEEKDRRIEALAQRVRELNETHAQSEEQFSQELRAQKKLVDLFKQSTEDGQKQSQELLRTVEEMQKLLQETSKAHNESVQSFNDAQEQLEKKLEEKNKEIVCLQKELQNANDVLSKSKGWNPESLEKIFPTAAATSKVLRSGMTLTQVYSEYVKAQEDLQKEKNENQRLSQQLQQIVNEIEENTPVLNQRFQEYQKALETISCLRSQLANSLLDQERLQSEKDDSSRITGQLQRENDRLRNQASDLAQQVRTLLKEVEESRGGFVKTSINDEEQLVTSSDETTASGVISRHLVVFRDIEDLQAKNQQLLSVVRDLSEKQEKEEKHAVNEKTEEMRQELDNALSQLEELKKERSKQAEMVESVVRQRDMYRVLLTHQGFSPSMLGHTSVTRGRLGTASEDAELIETKAALKQLQHEYDTYRKGRIENANLLTEQLDKVRDEVSDLRIQNAKLSSQLEYSNERFSLLQSSVENYKREAVALREKNQKHSTLITQHQQTINTLRQDLMADHEKMAKAEVLVENLRAEKELMKEVELRLIRERESLMKEHHRQSQLVANLQTVQNNLQRMETETQNSLRKQVERLDQECTLLRSKLEHLNEEYRSAVKVWEKQAHDLQQKVDKEVDKGRKTHEELVDAYAQVHDLKQQLAASEAKLANAETQLAKKPSPEPDKSPVKRKPPSSELKNYKDQLMEGQNEIKALQGKIVLVQKTSDHFRHMSNDLELRLKEQNEINQELKNNTERTLKESHDARRRLEQQLEQLEKKNRSLMDENLRLTEENKTKLGTLENEVTSLRRELDSANDKVAEAKKIEAQARDDCLKQAMLIKEAQEKYERELMHHANDVEQLSKIKEELKTKDDKIELAEKSCEVAKQVLTDSKESWEKRKIILETEHSSLKQKNDEIVKQNEILHERIELLGSQLAAIKSKPWKEILDTPDSSDDKSTEKLLEVIRYVRREKEIAATQHETTASENSRLKLKVEQLERQLEDAKKELGEVNEKTQTTLATEAQHAELLRKVEMLNVLTESNRLLRQEKEELFQNKLVLETKIAQLDLQLSPLQDTTREQNSQLDVLSAENIALRGEMKRWQTRTNQLLEQSQKMGPEEHKMLTKKNETLQEQINILTEELHKKQAEVSHINANLTSLRNTLEGTELETESYKQQLSKKQTEYDALNTQNIERQKTINQVRKIARNYKTQYLELKSQYDKISSRPAETPEVGNSASAQAMPVEEGWQEKHAEIEQKLKEKDEKIKQLLEELEKSKEALNKVSKEEETTRLQAVEKEERAKKVMVHVKQKLAQLSSQKDALTKDKNTLSKELEDVNNENSTLKQAAEEETLRVNTLKSQFESKLSRQDKELKSARDTVDKLEKQIEDLNQKLAQHQKQAAKISATGGLVERGSTSTSEPLTANIKPLAPPAQTAGSSVGLRHPPHPHTAPPSARTTPTASIRPLPIGSPSPTGSQTRMAAVLPTTAIAQIPPSEESSGLISQVTVVPQATVQPTPAAPTATATVAPTTVAVITEHPSATVAPSSHTPVISEVPPNTAGGTNEAEANSHPEPSLGPLVTPVAPTVSAPATALVSPRVEVSGENMPESQEAGEGAPTTSVIVSPGSSSGVAIATGSTTQTQIVNPTMKRVRDELDGQSEIQDGSGKIVQTVKRVRMVSEASQTNQQVTESTSASTCTQSTNVAVVSAALVVSSVPHLEECPQSPAPSATDRSSAAPDSTVTTTVITETPGDKTLQKQAQEASQEAVYTTESEKIQVDPQPQARTAVEIAEPTTSKHSEVIVVEISDEETPKEAEKMETQDSEAEEAQHIDEGPGQDEEEEMPGEDDAAEVDSTEEEMPEQPPDDNPEDIIVVQDGDETGMDEQDSVGPTAPIVPHSISVATPSITIEPVRTTSTVSFSSTETMAVPAPPISTTRPPFSPHVHPCPERLPSIGGHLPLFTIPGQSQGPGPGSGYDDGDSIVPRTPTLVVPRQDEFPEAVSPQVHHGRFLFSGHSEVPTSQQPISQLGVLGMDDTRMDLSQFDEGSSRSVPSTPLQVSPPADVTATEVPESSNMDPISPSPGCSITSTTDVGRSTPQTIPTITVTSEEDTLETRLEITEVQDEQDESSMVESSGQVPAVEEPSGEVPEVKASDEEEIKESSSDLVIIQVTSEEIDASLGKSEDTDPPIVTEPKGEHGEEMSGDKNTGSLGTPSQTPPSLQQQAQRKPIVWEEEPGSSGNNAPAGAPVQQSFSSPALLATPVGQKGTRSRRGRHIRLRNTSYPAPRGGSGGWSGARRGRGGAGRGGHIY